MKKLLVMSLLFVACSENRSVTPVPTSDVEGTWVIMQRTEGGKVLSANPDGEMEITTKASPEAKPVVSILRLNSGKSVLYKVDKRSGSVLEKSEGNYAVSGDELVMTSYPFDDHQNLRKTYVFRKDDKLEILLGSEVLYVLKKTNEEVEEAFVKPFAKEFALTYEFESIVTEAPLAEAPKPADQPVDTTKPEEPKKEPVKITGTDSLAASNIFQLGKPQMLCTSLTDSKTNTKEFNLEFKGADGNVILSLTISNTDIMSSPKKLTLSENDLAGSVLFQPQALKSGGFNKSMAVWKDLGFQASQCEIETSTLGNDLSFNIKCSGLFSYDTKSKQTALTSVKAKANCTLRDF